MLKYPCLVLDHDDTVVQSERTVNFPCFQIAMAHFRPGVEVTLRSYTEGCFRPGFVEMCRQWYGYTDAELEEEYGMWKEYVKHHIPAPFPGMERVIRRQKELGGLICVVSQSCEENILRDYRTHFGILPDAVYGWDLPEEQRKPSVFALKDIMARFGLKPEQMLMVDDMKPGRDMAQQVQVASGFAGWGKADYPEICGEMEQLCDFSFASPEALEHFLFGA